VELSDQFKAELGDLLGNREQHQVGWDNDDLAWTSDGATFANTFDTWSECDCRKFVKMFTDGKKKLSDYFRPIPPERKNRPSTVSGGVRQSLENLEHAWGKYNDPGNWTDPMSGW
jgi:hypothetical protein